MRLERLQVRRIIVAFAALNGAILLLVLGYLAYCAFTLPLSRNAATEPAAAAILYAGAAGTPFAARGVYHGDKITADHLPANLVKAVVAIEDRRFYQHWGIDLHGILRAAWRNVWGRRIEGGSTITQQLARVSYLSPERSLHRKVQELMLALWLEARLNKNEILARYLNSVYFGGGAIGADAAARRYFGKPAEDLDIAEAALLAGLIRAPSQLSPSRDQEAARRRRDVVLAAMVEDGASSPAEAAAAKAEPVRLAAPPENVAGDGYFLDTAEAEAKRLVGAPPIDLSVATTFDPRLQDAAEKVVEAWLGGEGARRHAGQAALVALAPDGAILALVGGGDYGKSQFNRVTQAKRQPGSLFKIFDYLTAFTQGYGPDSVLVDQPVQIGDWQPRNYDERYRGPVTLKDAFAQSINSIAAQLVQAVGVDRVIAMAKSLGVQSELPAVPSLALGSGNVTLLEMTRAMDAIATDRQSIEPYAVREIRSAASLLYTRAEASPARPEWQAARAPMMRLLEAVVKEGTGKAARLPDRRAAGKTGTAEDYRDAWFVGFTTDFVVGVWVGNDDNSPMDEVAGGDIPAKIWHDFAVEAERILTQPGQPAPTPEAASVGSSTGEYAAASAAAATKAQLPDDAASLPAAAAQRANPPEAKSGTLRGIPFVIDSGTLLVNGTVVHLDGIEGETGEPAHQLYSYLAGREVTCEPVSEDAARFRCRVGDYDVAEAALLNGAGRASADAAPRLRAAERQARRAGRGLWPAQ